MLGVWNFVKILHSEDYFLILKLSSIPILYIVPTLQVDAYVANYTELRNSSMYKDYMGCFSVYSQQKNLHKAIIMPIKITLFVHE